MFYFKNTFHTFYCIRAYLLEAQCQFKTQDILFKQNVKIYFCLLTFSKIKVITVWRLVRGKNNNDNLRLNENKQYLQVTHAVTYLSGWTYNKLSSVIRGLQIHAYISDYFFLLWWVCTGHALYQLIWAIWSCRVSEGNHFVRHFFHKSISFSLM